jgi:hypothetical protein
MKALQILVGLILISVASAAVGTDLDVYKLDSPPAMWLKADSGITHNGGLVNTWGDQSGNGRHATQANTTFQPMLVEGALNEHPVVRFSADSLSFNGNFLIKSSYTVIVVEARDRFGLANFFISGSARLRNGNLVFGYQDVALLRQAHFGNDLDAVVPVYTGSKEFALTTFSFDRTVGRSIFRHGEVVAEDGNTVALNSYANPVIGSFPAYSGYYYEGDIAELIFFDTALSDCDRVRVENYLATKYGLAHVSDPGLNCPTFLSCEGFEPPMAQYPVRAKKNRALPLKSELFDEEGFSVLGGDLTSPPILQVWYEYGTVEEDDASIDALPAGKGTEGNQFVFTEGLKWQFNLKTSNYSGQGTYTVIMESGDPSEYVIGPSCLTEFVIK